MPHQLAYIGFGALGRQLSSLFNSSEGADEVYFDDHAYNEGLKNAFKFEDYLEETYASHEFVVALGYKQLQKKYEIISHLKKLGRHIATYSHPFGFIDKSATIEAGTTIYAGHNIDQNVTLKEGVLLNNSVTVSHDSIIGSCSFLAPGVTICGNVSIGERCFIGAGTIITNNISIGDDVLIGPGTLVTSNIQSGSSVIGNPMRILDKKIELR